MVFCACHSPPQDLPLTYRFACVIDGSDSFLSGDSVSNVLTTGLPAGPATAQGRVQLVVVVKDLLGAGARGTVGPDRASPLVVTVTAPVVTADSVAEFLLTRSEGLLDAAVSQGRVGAVLSNVVIMASVRVCGLRVCW